ncbi:family 16 glycoside hydrolase, partial [Burkholderia sp. SIMBA_024]|uniref:family 16 glycoside hydrolase n=1 Tax=Burkholderia sp. SIMBA_024 TaxID=3085768 RepID=UPI00397E556A
MYVRGSSKNQVNMGNRFIGSGEIYGYRADRDMPREVRQALIPRVNADAPPGEWNRYRITMKGDRITVVLNGRVVIDDARLPG